MPVRKVAGGYRYGTTGKIYPTKAQAEKQGRAIALSQAREAGHDVPPPPPEKKKRK